MRLVVPDRMAYSVADMVWMSCAGGDTAAVEELAALKALAMFMKSITGKYPNVEAPDLHAAGCFHRRIHIS
jgi:hypothetical protein